MNDNEMLTVTDIITPQIIQNWEVGDKILIKAGTGKGKSYFIRNSLTNYADVWGNKILLLVNRTPLKEQIEAMLEQEGKQELIDVKTYQGLENEILSHKEDFTLYKYVVCDEAHYFFTDSTFNHMTNLGLKCIKEQLNDKIVILMSATPSMLKPYLNIKDEFVYELPNQYQYVNAINIYKKSETAIHILNSLPKGEKAIYFASAEKAYEASLEVDDASFICSQTNKGHRKYSNKYELECIKTQERFNSNVLCTTIALDNGINIVDDSVKHIIVDMFDIDTIIQCIGRKRITSDNDTITLYVAEKSITQARTWYSKVTPALEQAVYLRDNGERAFREKYLKKRYDKYLIDIGVDSFEVNEAGAWKYSAQKQMCLKVMNRESTWLELLLKQMGLEHQTIIRYENICDKDALASYVGTLLGEKMFDKEQEIMKSTIKKLLIGTLQQGQKALGLNSINKLLKELDLAYTFVSYKEKSGEMRDKRYWSVEVH